MARQQNTALVRADERLPQQNGQSGATVPRSERLATNVPSPLGAPNDAGISAEQEILRQEVAALLREIRAYRLRFDKNPITPADLVGLVNRAVGKRLPDPAPDLLEDVARNLQDTSFVDLADQEVLRGMALMTYYSLQVQSEPYIKSIFKGLRRLPGYATIDELRKNMVGRPLTDLADSEVWTDIWREVSYSALMKVDEILQDYIENS